MKGLAVVALLSSAGCCLDIVTGEALNFHDGDRDAGTDAGSGVGCSPDSGAAVYAASYDSLYKIDPVTWEPTQLGSFGIGSDFVTDLAISSSNEIYVTSYSALYTVNPSTGAATLVMSYAADFNALTFLADGTLLGVAGAGDVSKIDLTHQTLEYVGSYGSDYDSSGDLVAVADGTIYATSVTSPVMSGPGDFLVKVDPTSGQATTVGPIGYQQVWGLAYYDGTVIAFTSNGQILAIDPSTGAGKLLGSSSATYYGAGVSPAVAPHCP